MKKFSVSVERVFIHCLTIEAETEEEAGQKAAEKIRAEFDHDGVSVMYAEDIEAAAESEKDLFLTMNGWKVEGDDLVRVSPPGQRLLTEEEIEIEVERAIDRLDKRFMRGELTQEEYDQEVHIVDKWANQQMKALS